MGRGRAKAKQTKVARELKYRSVGMDLNSLEAELRPADEDQHRVPDAYADLAEEYNPDEDPAQDDYQLRQSG
ncbi:MAG: DUF3073 domain-containing protein [Propionibacteriaceae bacterium]